jgi:hypothetical protein
MENKKGSKDAAMAFILVGLLVLILALVSMEQTRSGQSSSPVAEETIRPIDLVNKHLRDVYTQQERERVVVQNINTLTAPPLRKVPKEEPRHHFDELPLTFDQDVTNEILGEDLRIFAASAVRQRTLSEQIQKEVMDDLKKAAEEEAYKRALAESIIKKARDQGYEIQINDSFKVTSIKKIKKEKEISIFDKDHLPNR